MYRYGLVILVCISLMTNVAEIFICLLVAQIRGAGGSEPQVPTGAGRDPREPEGPAPIPIPGFRRWEQASGTRNVTP